MNRFSLLQILFLFLPGTLFSQVDTACTNHFGTPSPDGSFAICKTFDQGFLLAGYTYATSDGKPDMLFIKTDNTGQEIWRRIPAQEGWEFANSICQASDQSGYLVTGFQLREGVQQMDVLILKLNPEGDTVWVKSYGGSGMDYGSSILATSDGNYLICGTTNSFGAGEDDVYILKVDIHGDTLWTRTNGCAKSDMGYHGIETQDGKYMVVGSTGLFDIPGVPTGHNRDIYALKLDSDGSVIDSNNYYILGSGQGCCDNGYHICELSDGNFCISGACSNETGIVMNVAILKINPELNQLWKKHKALGAFYDFGYTVCEATADGSVVVAGSFNYANNATTDAFFLKVDLQGNEIWRMSVGGNQSESIRAICPMEDNQFMAAGFTNSYGEGTYDCWMVKVVDLITPVNDPQGVYFHLEQNYPNPTSHKTMIRFHIEESGPVLLTLFNGLGTELLTLMNEELPAGTYSIPFNTGNLQNGIYFYKLATRRFSETRRLILKR